ncbi:hypothetical protein Tco_0418573 [Tanacetum coccineum]
MPKPPSPCNEPPKENYPIAPSNQVSPSPHSPLPLNPYVVVALQATHNTIPTPPPPPPSPTREQLVDEINQLQDLSNLLDMHLSQFQPTPFASKSYGDLGDEYSGDVGMSKDMLGLEQLGELRRSWYVEGHVRSGVVSSVLAQRIRRSKLRRSQANPNIINAEELDHQAKAKATSRKLIYVDFEKEALDRSMTKGFLIDSLLNPLARLTRAVKPISPVKLSQKFLEEFSQQKRYAKDPTEIHDIKRRQNESLQAFMDKFKSKSSQIKGVPPVLRISAFMHGHNYPKLAKKLNDKIHKTVDEMFERIRAFIQGEMAAGSTEMIEEAIASGKLAHLVRDIRLSNQKSRNQRRNDMKSINTNNQSKAKKCKHHLVRYLGISPLRVDRHMGNHGRGRKKQNSAHGIRNRIRHNENKQGSPMGVQAVGKDVGLVGRYIMASSHGTNVKNMGTSTTTNKEQAWTETCADGLLKPQQNLCLGHVSLPGGGRRIGIANGIPIQVFLIDSQRQQPDKNGRRQ